MSTLSSTLSNILKEETSPTSIPNMLCIFGDVIYEYNRKKYLKNDRWVKAVSHSNNSHVIYFPFSSLFGKPYLVYTNKRAQKSSELEIFFIVEERK